MIDITIIPCQKAWQRQLAQRAATVLKPVLNEDNLGMAAMQATKLLLHSKNRTLSALKVQHERGRYGDRLVVSRPYVHAPELDTPCLILKQAETK